MMVGLINTTRTHETEPGQVAIWVPDPDDPLEGRWENVDPGTPPADPRRAAQASAVAKLWATSRHSPAA